MIKNPLKEYAERLERIGVLYSINELKNTIKFQTVDGTIEELGEEEVIDILNGHFPDFKKTNLKKETKAKQVSMYFNRKMLCDDPTYIQLNNYLERHPNYTVATMTFDNPKGTCIENLFVVFNTNIEQENQ